MSAVLHHTPAPWREDQDGKRWPLAALSALLLEAALIAAIVWWSSHPAPPPPPPPVQIVLEAPKPAPKPAAPAEGFGQMLTDSVKRVNDMQNGKDAMVESFASGQTQNVHELMINLQKASSAMQMTTAVRGKVIDAYRELVKIQF